MRPFEVTTSRASCAGHWPAALAAIRAQDGTPVHCERHRPAQTTLYRLVQQHAATFFYQAEAASGADLLQFLRYTLEAYLNYGILASVFLRLRCGDWGNNKLVALSCMR